MLISIKFDWNWPAGSEEFFFNINTCKHGFPFCSPSGPPGTIAQWFLGIFLNDPTPFLHFLKNNIHFEDDQALNLNSLKFPLSKNNFTKFDWNWLVLETIFKNCHCIFNHSLLFPIGKGGCPSFEQFWIPFTPGWFLPTLVTVSLVVLKKSKMYRSHRQMSNGQTNDDQKRSLELSVQVS
jgi:hypothetical protein